MFTAEIFFKKTGKGKAFDREQAIDKFLSALSLNGQTIGPLDPIAQKSTGYAVFVLVPERTSLSTKNNSEIVSQCKGELKAVGLTAPKVTVLGRDPETGDMCKCKKIKWLVLYTTFINCEPPLRCGVCFEAVPLYRVLPTGEFGDYSDVHCWEATYRACDRLHVMNSVGEKFGYEQISKWESDLSKEGIRVCQSITKISKIPTFYYLYKYTGKSVATEKKRKCPQCKKSWSLKKNLHEIIDFQCKKCKLVSNIAFDVQ